ncbi:MAG: ABC transporter permease subunit [Candidatus Aminicenantes bacterium]|nr:ABC transporter permease subunit [Candidatus Aminicenantes bacterium]
MSNFIAIFIEQLKRFFCLKKIVLWFLFIGLSLAAVYSGIDDDKINRAKAEEFKKLETLIFQNMSNYLDMSHMGIDVFCKSAAIGILFAHPAVLTTISANINTIVTLKIFTILQSGVIFKAHPLMQFRFSSILLLLGSLLVLFFGYDSLRDLEYLKFLSSASSETTVYISIIVSRFLVLILSYLFILLLALGVMAIKGIYLTQSDFTGLIGFLKPVLLMLLSFFLLGTAIGKIRSLGIGITALLVLWIILIVLWPIICDSIVEKKANEITSYYKIHNDKLTVVSEFEKKAEKDKGAYIDNTPEGRKEVVEGYWKNVFPLIEKLDEQPLNEITQVIKEMQYITSLTPATFYLAVANEASSRGYQNFLNFYKYLLELRRQLVRFWIDRVYYNDPTVMVNFVKKDENVFKAKSQLPFYFYQGVVINLCYCIVLLFVSYFLFRFNLFHLPKNSFTCTQVNLKIKPKQIIGANKDFPDFFPQILNVFFGKIKHFTGKISIDGENIVTPVKKNFIYLPQHEHFPDDIKTKDLIAFFKRLFKLSAEEFLSLKDAAGKANLNKYFVKLSKVQKTKLLLTLVSFGKNQVYILDDFGNGSTINDRAEMNKLSTLLRDKSIIVLDLCTSGIPWLSTNAVLSVSAANNEFISIIQI